MTDVRDCASGCFKYLAATITTCLYSVVNWAAVSFNYEYYFSTHKIPPLSYIHYEEHDCLQVPYCVQHAIGAGDQCFDCVCEAVEWMCNCDVC